MTDNGPPERRTHVIFLVTCALVTLLVYANSAFNGFVWDDKSIIVNNPLNRDLANMFQVLFSPDIGYQGDSIHAYYRPLNRLSYIIDYQLFGLNPVFYHLENISIHLMNVLLLYRLSLILLKNAEAAFVTAILFAVHPVNAEAVNFISGKNNLNAVFFVLLSLLTYLHSQEAGKRSYCYLAAIFFFLGLLCKETAAMLVFVILFHQFRFHKETLRNKLATLAPFAIFAAAYLVMRQESLSSGLLWTGQSAQGIGQRMLQDLYIVPKYLSVLFLPTNLNAYYMIPKDYLAHGAWLLAAWLVLTAAAVAVAKRGRSAGRFGLLWLVVNFIPISNLVPIPSAPMAERYLYLPAIGLWIIAGERYAVFSEKPSVRKPLAAGLFVLVAVFGAVTFARNIVWKDEASLFTSMIQAEPQAAFGYYNLGCVFKDRGDIAQAQRLWEKALDIEPRHAEALNQIGSVYLIRGFAAAAAEYFALSVQGDPGNAEAQYNLAMTQELLGKTDQAVVHYEVFLKKAPPEYRSLIPAVSARISHLKDPLRRDVAGK